MKKTLLAFIVLALFLVGCSSVPSDVEKAINDNIKYANEEDIEGYMSTIAEDSPIYEPTRSQMEMVAEIYDLEYSIDEMEVVEESDESIKVKITQTTRKIAGPDDFLDNQMIAVQELVKRDGQWKFYSAEVVDMKKLD